MENSELRKALKIWVRSGQIERYQFGIVSDRFKLVLAWLTMGAFSGFIVGFLTGLLARG
jgi:hypothetical protein